MLLSCLARTYIMGNFFALGRCTLNYIHGQWFVMGLRINFHSLPECTLYVDHIGTCKQPIRTRYLGHVTIYQPIRDQCSLIHYISLNMAWLEINSNPTSTQKKVTFVLINLSLFVSYALYSLPGAFLPVYDLDRGISPTFTG
eukprot:sb/3474166/